MIRDHDLSPADDCGDVNAHGKLHKSVRDVEFRVHPATARGVGHMEFVRSAAE
jgi:hypothetical protein